jgi:hypothetical protein
MASERECSEECPCWWRALQPGESHVITSALVKARPWESVVGEGQEGSVPE